MDISYTPEWLANVNLNWQGTENLLLFATVNYTGKQKDGQDNTLDDYSILSLGGAYTINDNFTIKTGVTNLTDERLDKSDLDYEDTEMGRTYYLTVDFEF
jgi:outer membrane receptor for ferrienterochelin and colicins